MMQSSASDGKILPWPIHVSTPWSRLSEHLGSLLRLGLTPEIGFGGQELDDLSNPQGIRHLRTLADMLQSEGCRVTLHGPFWDLNPGSQDPLVRQVSRTRLHQFLDIVPILQPLQVICHAGYDPRHYQSHRHLWQERSLAFWEPMVHRAEVLKTPLLLENVWEHTPAMLSNLLGAIASDHFGFCLDVGHRNAFARATQQEWLVSLSPYLREIHLHDNDSTGDAHLPIGWGNVDFAALFAFLGAEGLNPVMTIEPHREDHLAPFLAGLQSVCSQRGCGQ